MCTHILHDANSLLGLSNKLIFSLFNLRPRFFAQLLLGQVLASSLAGQGECRALGTSFGRIQAQSRVLDILASACRKLDVGVQRRTPAREEAALDLCVLRKTSLADLLGCDGVLLEGCGERVFARAGLLGCEHVRGVQGRAGDGMAECLGLGLCGGWRDEGGLGFGGGCGVGEEVDLLGDSAAKVSDGLADVGWVVVGFVGVLRAASGVLDSSRGWHGAVESHT